MPVARQIQGTTATAYDRDYYGWLVEQVALLESGGNAHADWANIAEALRDLGGEQLHKLQSALRVLMMHLLKWDYQPAARTRSWMLTIRVQRSHVQDRLSSSGSLRAKVQEVIPLAFYKARLKAADETGLALDAFPLDCPYTFDELMTRDIPWPPQD